MRRIARYAFYLSCLLFSTVVMAQTKITGKVAGPDGQGIPGASGLIKGAKLGNSTDDNGIFSINVTQGQILVVSATGYATKEISVNNTSEVTVIALAESKKVLQE